MTEEEKLEKSGDYFANPKKDTGKRRGRRPGSKNKKTLEKEREVRERMEQEQMQKSKTKKSYFGEYDANLVNIINASENITHGAKIMQRELDKSFKDGNLLNPENYDVAMVIIDCINTIRTEIDKIQRNADSLDSFARTYVNEDGTMKSNTNKSVTFKGYNGTWKPIAKANHYTMWESVEMGDKAFNIVTVTKKKRETGELIKKIAFEDVDGIEDAKVKGLGLKKYVRGYEEEQNQLGLVLYESHDELERIRDRVYDASTSYYDTTETHQRFDDLFKAIDTAKDVCIREYDNL